MTNTYRDDNTEGYTQSELDALNAELEQRLTDIEPDSDEYHETIKRHADEVSRRPTHEATLAARAPRAIPSDRPPQSITVCLLGDDRERSYDVTWYGRAEDIRSRGEDDLHDVPVALVRSDRQDGESIVYRHPVHGWTSLWDASCRSLVPVGGYPEMTDERLNAAA